MTAYEALGWLALGCGALFLAALVWAGIAGGVAAAWHLWSRRPAVQAARRRRRAAREWRRYGRYTGR